MPIVVRRNLLSVEVEATCERCRARQTHDALTAGAAIDKIEDGGWTVRISDATSICARCVQ